MDRENVPILRAERRVCNEVISRHDQQDEQHSATASDGQKRNARDYEREKPRGLEDVFLDNADDPARVMGP